MNLPMVSLFHMALTPSTYLLLLGHLTPSSFVTREEFTSAVSEVQHQLSWIFVGLDHLGHKQKPSLSSALRAQVDLLKTDKPLNYLLHESSGKDGGLQGSTLAQFHSKLLQQNVFVAWNRIWVEEIARISDLEIWRIWYSDIVNILAVDP